MREQTLVNWQSPEEIPNVGVYELQEFWIAVERTDSEKQKYVEVFAAHYVNKPLIQVTEDEESVFEDENPFCDYSGEAIECVGWYAETDNPDYDRYYNPIEFGEFQKLMGWAVMSKPDFGVNAKDLSMGITLYDAIDVIKAAAEESEKMSDAFSVGEGYIVSGK